MPDEPHVPREKFENGPYQICEYANRCDEMYCFPEAMRTISTLRFSYSAQVPMIFNKVLS